MVILERVVMVIMGGCLLGLAMCFGYYQGYMQGNKDLSEQVKHLMDKYEPHIDEVS